MRSGADALVIEGMEALAGISARSRLACLGAGNPAPCRRQKFRCSSPGGSAGAKHIAACTEMGACWGAAWHSASFARTNASPHPDFKKAFSSACPQPATPSSPLSRSTRAACPSSRSALRSRTARWRLRAPSNANGGARTGRWSDRGWPRPSSLDSEHYDPGPGCARRRSDRWTMSRAGSVMASASRSGNGQARRTCGRDYHASSSTTDRRGPLGSRDLRSAEANPKWTQPIRGQGHPGVDRPRRPSCDCRGTVWTRRAREMAIATLRPSGKVMKPTSLV